MNTYDMLQEVKSRLNIDEDSENPHWSNIEILRKIRLAHKRAWMKLSMKRGAWLGTSSNVTAAAGVITLPDDCGKIFRVEETSTKEQILLKQIQFSRDYFPRISDGFLENSLEGYLWGNTIQMIQADYAEQVTIFYDIKYVDPICGTADSGSGANTLVFKAADRPSVSDDDYNGVYIEIVSGTGIGTVAAISDYVGSTRTATISGTFGSNSIYGSLLQIPQEAEEAIILEAAKNAAAKPGSHLKDEYYRLLRTDATEAWDTFENWVETRIKDTQLIGG